MNVAGMVLGIIAIVFAFIPVFGAFIAIPCVLVGLPLAAVDFGRKKRNNEGLGMAIAGIATNIIAFLMAIAWIILIVVAGDTTDAS